MVARLAHICFRTNRFKEMVDFYGNVMGLTTKFTFKSDKGKVFGQYFNLGNRSFLEIFDSKGTAEVWGGEGEPEFQQGVGCYQHFCLEVNSVDQTVAELEAKGVEVTGVKVGMDQSKQAWIQDPDGNPIELMEYTAKSWQLQ